MKKNFVAFALALLLVFSMAGGAFADTTYVSLGEVEVGVFFKELLATVNTGNFVSASEGSLPSGCQIVTEESTSGLNIYLSGTPDYAGNYNCSVDLGNGNSLICSLNVMASKPSVVASPDAVCSVNEVIEIFVKASISSGNLSYQWYENSVDSNTNEIGRAHV